MLHCMATAIAALNPDLATDDSESVDRFVLDISTGPGERSSRNVPAGQREASEPGTHGAQ